MLRFTNQHYLEFTIWITYNNILTIDNCIFPILNVYSFNVKEHRKIIIILHYIHGITLRINLQILSK